MNSDIKVSIESEVLQGIYESQLLTLRSIIGVANKEVEYKPQVLNRIKAKLFVNKDLQEAYLIILKALVHKIKIDKAFALEKGIGSVWDRFINLEVNDIENCYNALKNYYKQIIVTDYLKNAYSGKLTIQQIIEKGTTVFSNQESDTIYDFVTGEKFATSVYNTITTARESYLDRVKSGMFMIDSLVGGFERGTVTTFCATASCGKTSLLLQILVNAAIYQGKRVLYFAYEMDKSAFERLIFANVSGIRVSDIMAGKSEVINDPANYCEEICKKAEDANMTPLDYVLHLISRSNFDVITLENQKSSYIEDAEALVQDYIAKYDGVDLVMFDYSQLMDTRSKNAKTTTDKTEATSLYITQLAGTLKIPVIIVSQVSVKTDFSERSEKMKVDDYYVNIRNLEMRDVKNSTQLIQDSSNIFMVDGDKMPDNYSTGVLSLKYVKGRLGIKEADNRHYFLKFNKKSRRISDF